MSDPLRRNRQNAGDLPPPAPEEQRVRLVRNLAETMDGDAMGVFEVSPEGRLGDAWGLARKLRAVQQLPIAWTGPLALLIERSRKQQQAQAYIDGHRYFAGCLDGVVTVLVTNAAEEMELRNRIGQSNLRADLLKRLGTALTMSQGLDGICTAAGFELASCLGLAAVLLWTVDETGEQLNLTSHVGINRPGVAAFSRLEMSGTPGCMAEVIAVSRATYVSQSVLDSILTANLEAKFCYLKPGGVAIHPLVTSDRMVGVLEFIGRDEDAAFIEHAELFQTVTEHLALAIDAAMMFENYERLASHDPLTGLANHRTLHEVLASRLTEAERTGRNLGVIMIDVDHFRSFNEEEGHDAGDDVLRQVAHGLQSIIRPYDLAARYGGEEFTVLMPGADLSSLLIAAERIRSRIASEPYHTRSGRERFVTVSVGCSHYPLTATDGPSLLKAADTALYASKRAGRNQVTLYEGVYRAAPRVRPSLLAKAFTALKSESPESAQARVERLRPIMDGLVARLKLTETQARILEALVCLGPDFLTGERIDRNAFDPNDLRAMMPSLEGLHERFDGQGPQGTQGVRVPLLSRIAQVLLAWDDPSSALFANDPGRFDPELLEAVYETQRAS